MSRELIETEPFVEYQPKYENVDVFNNQQIRVRNVSYENVPPSSTESDRRDSSSFPYGKLRDAVDAPPPTLPPRTHNLRV